MIKMIRISIIVILLGVVPFLLRGDLLNSQIVGNAASFPAVGEANPAAVYCDDLGYQYDIVTTSKGQVGVCMFPDGSSCDEWDFLSGKCGVEYSYCARQGYNLEIKN